MFVLVLVCMTFLPPSIKGLIAMSFCGIVVIGNDEMFHFYAP